LRAALIQNPKAGSARPLPCDILRERYELLVLETSAEQGPAECARQALAQGAELVIAAGGDGTASAVAGAVVGTDVPLGVIACGTSNSFAAALGIPEDAEAACRLLNERPLRRIDTARCGNRVVILHGMIGMHADAIAATKPASKHRWGSVAYVVEGLRRLAHIEPFHVHLDAGANHLESDAITIAVANVAPRKTALAQGPPEVVGDDGLLDVTIVAARTLGEVVTAGIELVRSAQAGEAARDDRVGFFRARSLRIVCDPPQRVLLDGEDGGSTPVTFGTALGDLWVVAPED
jgi:diacylglycerol kinase family enzyme